MFTSVTANRETILVDILTYLFRSFVTFIICSSISAVSANQAASFLQITLKDNLEHMQKTSKGNVLSNCSGRTTKVTESPCLPVITNVDVSLAIWNILLIILEKETLKVDMVIQ